MKKINDNIERIALMRKGQQIKCPKCNQGFFVAVGDPITTKAFKCNYCPAKIILSIHMK